MSHQGSENTSPTERRVPGGMEGVCACMCVCCRDVSQETEGRGLIFLPNAKKSENDNNLGRTAFRSGEETRDI